MNKVEDFALEFRVKPELVPGISKISAADFPLEFSNVTKIKEFYGTYTPNDDNLVIGQTPEGMRPTFIFFACDKRVFLYTTNQNDDPYLNLPVDKILCMAVDSVNSFQTPVTFFLQGQANQNPPMAQGSEVKWYLCLVEADIAMPTPEV